MPADASASPTATADRPPPADVDVRLAGVRKTYGPVVAVDEVDLSIARGEFFTLLGPSGSGKTTCLRMIAGFERPDAGRVELAGADVTRQPPAERDVNTVFQDYALFPHMTVAGNVAYGMRVSGSRRRSAAPGSPRPSPWSAWRGWAIAGRPSCRAASVSRRPGPGAGQPPARAAARRAARRAGPQAAPAAAGGAQAHPDRRRHHLRLRHPRPGRGADHERPHRGHGRRPRAAGRPAP